MKRVLGKVSNDIVENWALPEYKDMPIVIYPEAREHSKEEHLRDYEKEEDYYYVMDSLEDIIKNPDYVFYDKSKEGLEYYKKIRGNILVAVRVKQGKELKVKSVYPVKEIKIENRKRKESEMKLYNNYVKDVIR